MALKRFYTPEGVGGGGGTEHNFIRGGSNPRSNPLPFYNTIFGIKDTPFVFMLLKNDTPVTYYFVTLHNVFKKCCT